MGQIAAIVGALGAALVLLGKARVPILAGLALLAVAETGLVVDLSDHGHRVSPSLVALGAAAVVPMALLAAFFVRWPALVTPVRARLGALPAPTLVRERASVLRRSRELGQLGRLLPLYGVLGATALALGWNVLRAREVKRVPPVVALPAVAFLSVAALSLLWTNDLHSGENVLAYFLFPFAVLVAVVARAPFPDWMTRVLAVIAIALATLFAVVGLIQAATHKLWFFSPAVEIGNAYSSFFRVTSLFRDPSLYARHVVLGIAIVLVALLYRRINPLLAAALVALLFAGLWFSYSQSSMAALFVVTLAIAAFAGSRSLKLAAALTALVVLVAAAADRRRLGR